MEMVDGMKIVVEAGERHFPGRQSSAIVQPPLQQQDAQTRLREIAAEHEPMVPRADDDTVVNAARIDLHVIPLHWQYQDEIYMRLTFRTNLRCLSPAREAHGRKVTEIELI